MPVLKVENNRRSQTGVYFIYLNSRVQKKCYSQKESAESLEVFRVYEVFHFLSCHPDVIRVLCTQSHASCDIVHFVEKHLNM